MTLEDPEITSKYVRADAGATELKYVDGKKLSEGLLIRIEHGIRLYDPCLSCSTHAVGQMAMDVQLVDADSALLDQVVRE